MTKLICLQLVFIIAANKTVCRITQNADVSKSDSSINRNKQNNCTVLHSNLQPFLIHQGCPTGGPYDTSQWRQNFKVNNFTRTAVMSALSVLIHHHFSTYNISSLETLAPLSGFTSMFGKKHALPSLCETYLWLFNKRRYSLVNHEIIPPQAKVAPVRI
jgi:hypothetical protein